MVHRFGDNKGVFGYLTNDSSLSGERLRINRRNRLWRFITAATLLPIVLLTSVLSATGWGDKAYIGLYLAVVVVGLAVFVVLLVRQETYLQLLWRERKAAQKSSEQNLKELTDYMDQVQKGQPK